MKKLSTILIAAFVLCCGAISAQCTIDGTNTTTGFTPTTPNPITQGTAYAQTVQAYVPASFPPVISSIDSLVITGITGMPAGITYVLNPATGKIVGGHNGAICFSGTTNAAPGAYTLAFAGNIYTNGNTTGASIASPPYSSLFNYTLTVVAGSQQAPVSCDTLTNVDLDIDTVAVYGWQAPAVGFVSGNGAINQGPNFFPITSVAERFTGAVGDSVTAAFIFFGYSAIKAADSLNTVKFYVYNGAGVLGDGNPNGPGARIDSATLTLKSIARDITNEAPTLVLFSNHAALTTSEFYVTVALPNTTGDTLAILTNTGDVPRGKGYLNLAGAGWLPYTDILGGIDSLGNFIIASLCGSAALPPVASFTAAPSAVCVGGSVSFTDQSTGTPTGYSWNFGDGSAAVTTQNATHTFTTAGTYNVVETVTNTGGSSTATNSVVVSPNPSTTGSSQNASSASATDGAAIVNVTGGASPYSYAWNPGSSSTDTLKAVAAGTYNVTVTDANTCTTTQTIVVSFSNGINTLGADVQVQIYPNPANDVLNFIWNVNSQAQINVYSITGALVKSYEVNGTAVNKLDIQNIASGTYLIRITDMKNNEQRSTIFNKL